MEPSTREAIALPCPELQPKEDSCLGFGYDSTSGEYKILKIHTNIDSLGEILTLEGGFWRNIDKHPRDICNEIDGMQSLPFENEAFQWIGIFGNYSVVSRNYSVVSFSNSNEVYEEISLPEKIKCSRGASLLAFQYWKAFFEDIQRTIRILVLMCSKPVKYTDSMQFRSYLPAYTAPMVQLSFPIGV
ncbi:hypothetical protein HAX54_013078 [Datura stramonium]|uniref:F-box associated beta-propeller type 3 domain-containing protein n=1 Tax=Datura stramonium TaxID=4076 RepID=A0ABS8RXZ3_DATST|nr:hypothetical protein [Datura stramonium]